MFTDQKCSYHLIQPTSKNNLYAKSKDVVSCSQWLHLLHEDVFIHSPFDFTTTTKGRQSRDIVSAEDRRVLHNQCALYSNDPPSMKMVAQLSIHYTPLFNIKVDSTKVDEELLAMPLSTQDYYCYISY
jgi:hypothetical protein